MTYHGSTLVLELKDWTDSGPVFELEEKVLNFDWEESKHKRDPKGRFANKPGFGFSHLLDKVKNGFPHVPGAPSAKPVKGGGSQVKPVSLRPGDVIEHEGKPVALIKQPKLNKDGLWVFPVTDGNGETTSVSVPGDATLKALARTPQPKDTAKAKKDAATLKELLGGDAAKPHIASKPASDILVGDVLIDADTGDQYTVKGAASDGGEVGIVGNKLNDPTDEIIDLGVFTPDHPLTVKVAPDKAELPATATPQDDDDLGSSAIDLNDTSDLASISGADESSSSSTKAKVWKHGSGMTLKEHADGSGTMTNSSGTFQLKPDELAAMKALVSTSGWEEVGGEAGPAAPKPGKYLLMDGSSLVVHDDGHGTVDYYGGDKGVYWAPSEVAEEFAKEKNTPSPLPEDPAMDADLSDFAAAESQKAAVPYLGIGFAGHYVHQDPGSQGFSIKHTVANPPGAYYAAVTWDDGSAMTIMDWSFIAPNLTPEGGGAYAKDSDEPHAPGTKWGGKPKSASTPGAGHYTMATSTGSAVVVVHSDGSATINYEEPHGPQDLGAEAFALVVGHGAGIELTKIDKAPNGAVVGKYELEYSDADGPDLEVHPDGSATWLTGTDAGTVVPADEVYGMLTGADQHAWSYVHAEGDAPPVKLANPLAGNQSVQHLGADLVDMELQVDGWSMSEPASSLGDDDGPGQWAPGVYMHTNGSTMRVNPDGSGTLIGPEQDELPEPGVMVADELSKGQVDEQLTDGNFINDDWGVGYGWNSDEGQWAAGTYTNPETGAVVEVNDDGDGTFYSADAWAAKDAEDADALAAEMIDLLGAEGPGEEGNGPAHEETVVDLEAAMAPVGGSSASVTAANLHYDSTDKVYTHPQGATILVKPDSSVMKWDKHGKKVGTSADAGKLLAGHGGWKPAAMADLLGSSDGVLPSFTPQAKYKGPVPPGLYQGDAVAAKLLVHPDGTGTWLFPDDSTYEITAQDVKVNFTSASANHGTWKQLEATDPVDTGAAVAPPNGGNASANLITTEGMDPELVKLAKTLDYPADYPWPQVPGAPPAKPVKGGVSHVKPVSLRPGDVVLYHDAPSTVVKMKKQGGGSKSYDITVLHSDGSTTMLTLLDSDTIAAVGRTPQPKDFAAAKKAKAQLMGQLAKPSAPPPSGIPEVEPVEAVDSFATADGGVVDLAPGDTLYQWMKPGVLVSVVVHDDGTATHYDKNGTPTKLTTTEANTIKDTPDDWLKVGTKSTSAPTLKGSGPILSTKAITSAKVKSASSAHVKKVGAVHVLPGGGTMEVTSSGWIASHFAKPDGTKWKVRPGQHKSAAQVKAMGYDLIPGGYVFTGIPSADADPMYLSEDDEGNVIATYTAVGGSVMWIPKASVSSKGPVIPHVPTTTAAPSVPTPKAHDTVDGNAPHFSTAGWKKIGAQGGSNPGGLFEAPDGSQFYVKAPATQTHVENEVLAARLYGAAGVKVPEVTKASLTPELGLPTKVGVASRIVAGKKNLKTKHKDAAYRAKIVDGFAVDAWLANWDAVSTGMDNMIEDEHGNPVRVDVGGSMLFRAMGGPKGDDFGDTVGETKTMTAGNGLDSGTVYGKITKAELKDSFLKHVAPITPDKIDQLVDSTMTDPVQRDLLKKRLRARRLDLAKQAGVKEADLPENVVPDVPTVKAENGIVQPWTSGIQVTHSEVFLGGKMQWFHTKVMPATQVPPGAVIFLDSDPSAPWVVTKTDPKPDGSGAGKMGLWGKKNGTGPEQFMMLMAPSSGERQVHVQTQPEAGWKPPPPPPPPTPGVKLDLSSKFVPPTSPAADQTLTTSLFNKMWQKPNARKVNITKAYNLLTPEQRETLKSVGLETEAAFVQHFMEISGSWDGTSNDSAARTLAFHHAVAVEFGLEDNFPWPAEQTDMTLKSKVGQHFSKYGSAYQAAARAIYTNTQNELIAAGVPEYVKVYRNNHFSKPETAAGGYAAPAPPWAWSAGVKTDVTLRPLSSFSWGQLGGFGSTHLTAVVPREMIFSLGPTGPGGLSIGEKELVLLGVKGAPINVTGGVKPSSPGYTPEKFFADHPELAPGKDIGMGAISKKSADGSIEYKVVGEPAPTHLGWDANEDWLKVISGTWPFVDDEGDEVVSLAELFDLYPDVNPRSLLELPIGENMPPMLREEIESIEDDPDGIGPFAAAATA